MPMVRLGNRTETYKKLPMKGFLTNSVRLGNRTYRLGAFSICEKTQDKPKTK